MDLERAKRKLEGDLKLMSSKDEQVLGDWQLSAVAESNTKENRS